MPRQKGCAPTIKRRRNQSGDVWWAEWTSYVRDLDGSEKAVHRSMVAGKCAEISKLAAKKLIYAEMDAQRPRAVDTFGSFCRAVWLPMAMRRWEKTTKVNMLSLLDLYVMPAFADAPLDSIRKAHVEAHLCNLAERGLGKAVGEKVLWLLRSILEEATENELIDRNPARKVKLPVMRMPEKTEAYTESEFRSMTTVGGKAGLMLRLLLFCGLRPAELCALRRGDLVASLLTVDEATDGAQAYKPTKTRTTRYVTVPPALLRDLRAYLETLRVAGPDAPMFVSERGRMFGRMGLFVHLRTALKDAGVAVDGFNLRRFRTTFSTYFEGDIADVQALLGHTEAVMTLAHYRREIPERASAAVATMEARFSMAEKGRVM
jgi:integrase